MKDKILEIINNHSHIYNGMFVITGGKGKLADDLEELFNNSSQLEPPVIKWREYKAEQPHYEGRFLIYYEYNNNPNIRNIFIADYLPAEGRFMNVLNDIEILYWAEVQPPSL